MLITMDTEWSDAAILAELGSRLQRERLNRNLTQSALADRAGLSRSTVAKLESGENFSMLTLIRVLRTLGLMEAIDSFLPEPRISPIQLADLGGRTRERASGRRSRSDRAR